MHYPLLKTGGLSVVLAFAVFVSPVWATESSSSFKDKIKAEVIDETKAKVKDQLQQVVELCHDQLDQATCLKAHPVHLIHQGQSIDALSDCLAAQTLQCIADQLITPRGAD